MSTHLHRLCLALLLSLALLLLSLSQFHLLALLWGCKHSAEGRSLWFADLGGRLNDFPWRRLLQLHIQRKLEFEVIWHNELELLADRRVPGKLEPGRCNTVNTIVERQAKPRSFILHCQQCLTLIDHIGIGLTLRNGEIEILDPHDLDE